MKKTLAVLAVVALMVGTSGCGCCRGLFGKSGRPIASPILSKYSPQCSPTCAPVSSSGSVGASCGCESGTAVTYGYNGEKTYYPMQGYELAPNETLLGVSAPASK